MIRFLYTSEFNPKGLIQGQKVDFFTNIKLLLTNL